MNNTERFVEKVYNYMGINDTSEISFDKISHSLNFKILYWPYSSELVCYNGKFKVFINELLTLQQQWQDFGHEMHHYFFDEISYDKLNESYGLYGETKADYFAYHFCVPTFMLMKLKGVSVYEVMSIFNVEYEFAMRRLDMHRSKLFERGGHIAMQKG